MIEQGVNMPFRMAESEGVAVVKVIGVGGGGGNAINTMVTNKLRELGLLQPILTSSH